MTAVISSISDTARINIRVQTIVVVTSVVLFAIKVAAYFLTNSVAVLTDALESTVNVVTGFTGLYSLKIAAYPSDENHPYGHGKAELISASFEGMLILVAGLVIIYESIINLLHPHPVKQLDYGIMLIGITAVINYLLGVYCIRTGQKNHSIALKASGKHLQSDTWTTLGIVLGLLLIRITNIQWIDSAAAILFGGLIIVEGGKIMRQSIAGIMDEADTELLSKLIQRLDQEKREHWIDLHNLRVIKYGHVLHLDCHLTVPWYLNVRDAHAEVDALEAMVRDEFQQSIEMFVHIDACQAGPCCSICPVSDCQYRAGPFEERLQWTHKNITSNERHRL